MPEFEIRLPCSTSPRACILVLTRNAPETLERCMRALAANLPEHIPVQTIVLLNGASDEVRERVQRIQGITVLTSSVNMGFAAGCNYAALHARGEFLVLLNDDTAIEPGWLEELIGVADREPDAGAVGSLVLFPDGTIQESGSAIWCDGLTTPFGRGEPADACRFTFVRRVDFCSGCSLLVRRWAWERIGGLSEEYYPAYYEDVDFCVGLRALGLHVMVAPASRVRHQEAVTATSDFKLFLIKHHRSTFVARRESWLRESGLPSEIQDTGAAMLWARRALRRLLIVDDRLPNPSVGSGYGRMCQTINELVQSNYSITFSAADQQLQFRPELERLGVEVVTGSLDDHLAEPDRLYDVVLISRPHIFQRFAAGVRDRQPHAALVYDAEALFHRRLERQAIHDSDPAVLQEAAQLLATETAIAAQCDDVVCVSDDEARFFKFHGTPHRVSVVRPTLGPQITGATFRERTGAVLVAGWLGGPRSPNADGLAWFAHEVMPILVRRIPWFRLRVTGANPPSIVTSLEDRFMTFVGKVNDLHTVYNAARVAISPLRFGSGVKMKMLEAISYGVPVVATTLGAEGAHEPAPGAVWIADEPADFADRVADLLLNRQTWEASRRAVARTAELWATPTPPRWRDVLERAELHRSAAAVAARAGSAGAQPAGGLSNRRS